MNEQQLQEAFILFLAQKSGAKNLKELEAYVLQLGEDGLKQAYVEFQKVLQLQTLKARKGAKLQYLKTLKHQCADDEELYYYKKGGSVGCGCKKKEDGGEVVKAKSGCRAIDEFKKARKASAGMEFAEKKTTKKLSTTNNSTTNKYPDPTEGGKKKLDPKTRKYVPVTEEDRKKWKRNLNDARKGKGEGTPQRKCGGKVKKNEDGSKINKNCGGAVAKFKMHRLGGSLNGILFMLLV